MSIAQYGRYGDTEVAHVAKGELVVPKQVLRKRPDLRQEIYKEIEKYGVKGERYVVGNKSNSINPHTGHPEFFLKKILPVVTGVAGAFLGGPIGAAIGTGIGSAIRGDNPANIATNALMGFGLGSLTGGVMAARGASFGALGAQPLAGSQVAVEKALADQAAARQAGYLSNIKDAFGGMGTLAKGALGIGTLAAASSALKEDEGEGVDVAPPPEAGSIAPLDMRQPGVTYYDETTGAYGAASPTYRPLAKGGDIVDTEERSLDEVINNFPRKTGQIAGPGTEKSDDIPAMLSDGEFVMTAKAVRGLGALNGANKDDKLEQRRKGAKMMYEMMDKFESKVA